jgi:integral membrane protein
MTDKPADRALRRYRVIAWIVGVLLIVLVCIGVPLKYLADVPVIAKWVGFVHGVFFYPLYLVLTVALAYRTRMPPLRMVLTMVAGTVPFLSFFAERETTRWVRSLDPERAEAVPAAS